jgi:diadenosine tetraphosphatase ApaH/serine/threonine PP2A family protein phosphatase
MRWTAETMTDENRAWLRQLPLTLRVTIAGRSVYLFHGSPLRANEYLWSSRPSRVLARIASDEADDLFAFGHTHEAFHRVVGQAHFVAAGSVGCGTEGDARARYAVVYFGEPDIAIGFRSVDYDHLSVVRDMAAASLSVGLLREPPAERPHLAGEPSRA